MFYCTVVLQFARYSDISLQCIIFGDNEDRDISMVTHMFGFTHAGVKKKYFMLCKLDHIMLPKLTVGLVSRSVAETKHTGYSLNLVSQDLLIIV